MTWLFANAAIYSTIDGDRALYATYGGNGVRFLFLSLGATH